MTHQKLSLPEKRRRCPNQKKKKPATATSAKKPEKKDNCGGRASGSRNFNAEDMVRLVKIVGEVLPLGQTGWSTVEKQENSQLHRDHKSLKAKFDAVSAVACRSSGILVIFSPRL